MDYFSEQFTQELEEYATNKAEYYAFYDKWSIYKHNAPERHVFNGKSAGIDANTIYKELLKNEAFFRISSLLPIELTQSDIESLMTVADIDLEKEQVWLFAWNWYIQYFELLTDKKTLKSDFYKCKHKTFMNLLSKMLCIDPKRRISFIDALNVWEPKTQDQTEDDDAESVSSHPPPVVADAVSVPPTSSVKRRLVLKGWGGPAARNKTRKNYGN